jgi:hypothetical protein
MAKRALGATFRQVLRSVALTLFPLAFVALFTWATAGSTSGNTTDPIRAAGWLWLGAHCIPFLTHIHGLNGALTVMPLAAIAFPLWAIRRGYSHVRAAAAGGFETQLIFSLWYALFAELIALASYSAQVSANLYLAPLYGFLLAMIGSSKIAPRALPYLKFALYLLMVVLGVGALVVAGSLVAHFTIVKSIGIVIVPGIVGGLLYTILQLLYLPNIALATVGYLSGVGFTFGSHTNVSPTHFTLHGISAIPVLGALPTGKHPILQYGAAIWPIFFIVIVVFIVRSASGLRRRQADFFISVLLFLLIFGLFCFLGSGELLTSSLRPVGIAWLKEVEITSLGAVVALILGIYLPALTQKIARNFTGKIGRKMVKRG